MINSIEWIEDSNSIVGGKEFLYIEGERIDDK